MKKLVCVLGVLGFAATATAQEVPAQTPKMLEAGIAFHVMPIGELKAEFQGTTDTIDAATAFAFAPFVNLAVGDVLKIGFMPRYIFNVKADGDTTSAKQLDLLVRIAGYFPIAPNMHAYGYGAPGYSLIFPPGDWPSDVSKPKGFVLGFGGGIAIDLTPGMFASAELGYQLGFHKISGPGGSATLSDNYLHIGAGVGARF